jgi:citrate-Mg2+:H+ or citrate-Ca2+:H+ symporter, CitMHS family
MSETTLAVLAFAMVATFMSLIMTKWLSAIVALIVVPVAFALVAGFAAGLGPMMLQGVRDLAPTGVMLLFAILYFGLMIDTGLFDPLIAGLVKIVDGDPVRILVGTAVLALIVSLDGDGATTYMITVSAMLPLYRHLKLDARMMACVIIMAGGVMNLLPWGGPTARAATALKLDPSVVFLPLIPSMLACAAWLLFVAYGFGVQERKRLGRIREPGDASNEAHFTHVEVIEEDHARDEGVLRPRLFWFNLLLTAALMVMLVLGVLPLPVLFMIAFAVASAVNYPSLQEQRRRLKAHAGNALAVAGLVFAAGIFMGILSGTQMVDAMANSVLDIMPPGLGPYMAPITALLSIPFTFLISNDAFYFGMLPILAKTAAAHGITAEEIARAALIGQQVHLLSPLVASTYLLVGMAGIEFGEHQRFTLPWALGACLVMLVSALLFGLFPLATSSIESRSAGAQGASVRVNGVTYIGIPGTTRKFLGIPFAQAPVGELRWRPPQPVNLRKGVWDATRFGSDCIQKQQPGTRAPGISEDCLTLNIWTPARLSSERLPVMVWIYGGGFTAGSGSLSDYDGEPLGRRGIVLVTFNYRVGVLGFLSHPALTAESAHHASGNYGLMDQIAALRWVHDHIRAFGGDSERVTVFGQSAGASSLSHLIASRAAAGLFQRAILQSPGAMRPLSTLADAEKIGLTLGADLRKLRALSASEVLELNQKIIPPVRRLTRPRALGPILDGWVVKSQEGVAYANGRVNRIPLIIGGNADEGRVFVQSWPIDTIAEYLEYVRDNFGAAADEALALYPATTDAEVKPALSALFADTQYHHGIRGVAQGMSALGPSVYRYQFDYRRPHDTAAPSHSAELRYVFGSLDLLEPAAAESDKHISDQMMRAWVQFAATGNPNTPHAPVSWRPFSEAAERYLVFDRDAPSEKRNYRDTELDFLERFFKRRL